MIALHGMPACWHSQVTMTFCLSIALELEGLCDMIREAIICHTEFWNSLAETIMRDGHHRQYYCTTLAWRKQIRCDVVHH